MTNVLEETSPKSRVSRVKELTYLMSFLKDETLRPLAKVALFAAGEDGTPAIVYYFYLC